MDDLVTPQALFRMLFWIIMQAITEGQSTGFVLMNYHIPLKK